MFTNIFLGFALAMDAFAVSVTAGIKNKNNIFLLLKIAVVFGVFQALMPYIGYKIGFTFKDLIESIDHFIAFGLLSIIGAKMIIASFKEENLEKKNFLSNKTIFVLAIATSMDALIAGITLNSLETTVNVAITTIGLITFIACLLGGKFGTFINKHFDNKTELIGGVILILIGTKILIEHLFF